MNKEKIEKILTEIISSSESPELKVNACRWVFDRYGKIKNHDESVIKNTNTSSLLENDNEQTGTTEESNDFESIPIIAVNGSLFAIGKFIRCNYLVGIVKDIRIPLKGEINETTIKITVEIRTSDGNAVIMEFPAKDCEDILKYALGTRG